MADPQAELQRLRIEIELEREHVAQMEKLLNHDPDTGLMQRQVLLRRLMSTIRIGEERFAYGIIRLDRGYQRIKYTRDRSKVLLYVTSERIKAIVGDGNLYQSDRSDEFLFIVPEPGDGAEITSLVDAIQDRVREYQNPPASDVSFGCHVGVAVYPDHAKTLDELQHNAEIALGIYEQKREHGYLYSPELGKVFHENEDLIGIMGTCIREGFTGFHMVYQPIVGPDSTLAGCEALMRWTVPGFGSIPPLRFIPLAEDNGYIRYLGKWALYQALMQQRQWSKEHQSQIFVSVNVSAIELESPDFVEDVATALESIDVSGDYLHLEITESSVMDNPDQVVKKLHQLHAMGIHIMLDDFGTGYSNLNYLNQFPLDTLKIAKEFVDEFPDDHKSAEVVRAVQALAGTFGFGTLAEGIETQKQFDALVGQGVGLIQGYLFSPPIDPAEFSERFLKGS